MKDNPEKKELKQMLAEKLPTLRAELRTTQRELTAAIGISRQSYTLYETGKKEMSWHIFTLLFLYFEAYAETKAIIQTIAGFEERAIKMLSLPADGMKRLLINRARKGQESPI